MGSWVPFLSLNYCLRSKSLSDASPDFFKRVPSFISLRTLKSTSYCFSMVLTNVSLRFWRNGPLWLRDLYPAMPGASGARLLAIVFVLLSSQHYYWWLTSAVPSCTNTYFLESREEVSPLTRIYEPLYYNSHALRYILCYLQLLRRYMAYAYTSSDLACSILCIILASKIVASHAIPACSAFGVVACFTL